MKKIGNFGAMMSALCLFAALLSARHDYRNRVTHTDQTSLTESAIAVGSLDAGYTTILLR